MVLFSCKSTSNEHCDAYSKNEVKNEKSNS